jgi:Arc/MetJ-type ribon-helix-helix transcriptional regulator
MGRMERPIIEIPAEVKEIVEQAVASGEFVSTGDMVASAVSEWKSSKLSYGYTIEELRTMVDEAENGGELIDGPQAFREIRDELEAYIASRSAQ